MIVPIEQSLVVHLNTALKPVWMKILAAHRRK